MTETFSTLDEVARPASMPRPIGMDRGRVICHDNVDEPLPELEDMVDAPIEPAPESAGTSTSSAHEPSR